MVKVCFPSAYLAVFLWLCLHTMVWLSKQADDTLIVFLISTVLFYCKAFQRGRGGLHENVCLVEVCAALFVFNEG